MVVSTIEVTLYECERCEYQWVPRKTLDEDQPLPKTCPSCKSPYWNTPRRNPKNGKKKSKG